MMAALYFGHRKPNSIEDFTEQFGTEVESLQCLRSYGITARYKYCIVLYCIGRRDSQLMVKHGP